MSMVAVRIMAMLTVVLAAAGPAACGAEPADDRQDARAMAARSIEEVLQDSTGGWMAIPGVVGTGIGRCDGEPCIRVMVARKTPEIVERIPGEVEGHRVDIVETGSFRALEPD